MSFLFETNSFNINTIPSDKIVLTANKGAMLCDIREKSSSKEIKSVKKGVNSVNTQTKLHNNEAKLTEKGAKRCLNGAKRYLNGAIRVKNTQNSSDFEVFGKIGVF